MKIKNFNPGPIEANQNIYFFDKCEVEYFEGDPFTLYGSIDILFTDCKTAIDIPYAYINIVKDSNGRTVSLSKQINREIVSELESLIYKMNVEL